MDSAAVAAAGMIFRFIYCPLCQAQGENRSNGVVSPVLTAASNGSPRPACGRNFRRDKILRDTKNGRCEVRSRFYRLLSITNGYSPRRADGRRLQEAEF